MQSLKMRRIARIKQEIRLLEDMNVRLMVKKLIFAGPVALLFLTLVIAWVILSFHMMPPGQGAILVAFSLAALLVWMFRYSLSVPVSIAILLIIIPLSFMDFTIPDLPMDQYSRKSARNAKIAKALEKRRNLLAKLESNP